MICPYHSGRSNFFFDDVTRDSISFTARMSVRGTTTVTNTRIEKKNSVEVKIKPTALLYSFVPLFLEAVSLPKLCEIRTKLRTKLRPVNTCYI